MGTHQVKTKKVGKKLAQPGKRWQLITEISLKTSCVKMKEAVQGNGWETVEKGGAGSPHPRGRFLRGQEERKVLHTIQGRRR